MTCFAIVACVGLANGMRTEILCQSLWLVTVDDMMAEHPQHGPHWRFFHDRARMVAWIDWVNLPGEDMPERVVQLVK